MSAYEASVRRAASRHGWAVERDGDELIVRDQAGRTARHLLGGTAEEAFNAWLAREREELAAEALA
jgi:hypothetical protein